MNLNLITRIMKSAKEPGTPESLDILILSVAWLPKP